MIRARTLNHRSPHPPTCSSHVRAGVDAEEESGPRGRRGGDASVHHSPIVSEPRHVPSSILFSCDSSSFSSLNDIHVYVPIQALPYRTRIYRDLSVICGFIDFPSTLLLPLNPRTSARLIPQNMYGIVSGTCLYMLWYGRRRRNRNPHGEIRISNAWCPLLRRCWSPPQYVIPPFVGLLPYGPSSHTPKTSSRVPRAGRFRVSPNDCGFLEARRGDSTAVVGPQ